MSRSGGAGGRESEEEHLKSSVDAELRRMGCVTVCVCVCV